MRKLAKTFLLVAAFAVSAFAYNPHICSLQNLGNQEVANLVKFGTLSIIVGLCLMLECMANLFAWIKLCLL